MTAPAPTVCPRCEGEGVIQARDWLQWTPCEECCCSECGETTDTPPLCARCQVAQDDADAAQAWREGRY